MPSNSLEYIWRRGRDSLSLGNYKRNKMILMTIKDIAFSYIGKKEIPGNMGFEDKNFENEMLSVGWQKTYAWCILFCELVWKKAMPAWAGYFDKMFSASVMQTWNNFKKTDYNSLTPIVGAIAIWQKYSKGKPTGFGHAGIVTEIYAQSFATVEGNAQPLTSKILTPTGYKLMGDIEMYDEVICPDGSYSRVIGIFPQGKRKIYKITFNDNTFVEASDNHLWKLFKIDGNSFILNTEQVLERNKNDKFRIPKLSKIDFINNKIQPIHPYILGLLIGDGHLKNKIASICTIDKEILEAFKQYY